MARMIDGDAVLGRYYAEYEQQDICDGAEDRDWLMKCLTEAPAITPPNEPLTLEELREMNGQPVWVEEINHWALIDIETGGRWSGIPFVVWAENGAKFTYNIKERKLHCYRRPHDGRGCGYCDGEIERGDGL